MKTYLEQTIIDPEYVAQNYKDLPSSTEESNCETISRSHKGGTVKRLVLGGDEENGFWEKIKSHVRDTMPILKFLRRHDSSAASVGKVYNGWYELGHHLAKSMASFKEVMVEKHAERWDYGDAAFFRTAYFLDPEFAEIDHSSNTQVVEGFMEVLEKMAILVSVRERQDKDGCFTDKWKLRAKAIKEDPMAQRKWDNYPDYPTAADDQVKKFCASVNAQVANFRGKQGIFARAWVMDSAANMPAHLWWDLNGSSVPELQCVARMVLAQPASASICERINSEFAFIKDRKRNRLNHNRADKLVRMFHNLRLLKNVKSTKYAEPAVGWAEEPLENSCVMKYGVATY